MKKRRFHCCICGAIFDWTNEKPKCSDCESGGEVVEINIDLNKIANRILCYIANKFDGEGDFVYEATERLDKSLQEMVGTMTSKERDTLMSYLSDEIRNISVSVRFNEEGEVEEAPSYHREKSTHKNCAACTSNEFLIGKHVPNTRLVPHAFEKAEHVQDDPRINEKTVIVVIMRNNSGIPYTHYVLPIDDPELPEKMKRCGIEGTVDDVRKALLEEGKKSYMKGSSYWISKGSMNSRVDYWL